MLMAAVSKTVIMACAPANLATRRVDANALLSAAGLLQSGPTVLLAKPARHQRLPAPTVSQLIYPASSGAPCILELCSP